MIRMRNRLFFRAIAETDDPIAAGLQLLLVQKGPQAFRFEFLLESADPFLVRRSVGQEEVVPVRWLAHAGHRTSPATASLPHAVPVPSREGGSIGGGRSRSSIPGPDSPGKWFLLTVTDLVEGGPGSSEDTIPNCLGEFR